LRKYALSGPESDFPKLDEANTPKRLQEASKTSGMKAALSEVSSLGILNG